MIDTLGSLRTIEALFNEWRVSEEPVSDGVEESFLNNTAEGSKEFVGLTDEFSLPHGDHLKNVITGLVLLNASHGVRLQQVLLDLDHRAVLTFSVDGYLAHRYLGLRQI